MALGLKNGGRIAMEKLFKFLAVALVILTAVSCEKDEKILNETSEESCVTLTAFTSDEETKTSFVKYSSSYYTYWSKGDKIAVIQNGNKFEFTLVGGADSKIGTFMGTNLSGFNASEGFIAFYPYESVRLEDSKIVYSHNVVEQNFVDDGIGVTVPMAAVVGAGSKSFTFKYLMGILKLNIKGASDETVTSINIGSSTYRLYGEASLNTNDSSNPYLNFIRTTTEYPTNITLKCSGSGVCIGEDGKSFFIVLPTTASNLSLNTFGILVNTSKGSYFMPNSSNGNIKLGRILSMNIDLENGTPRSRASLSVGYSENSTYYGDGVLIGRALWAPVNCGYKPAEGSDKGYPYGKYYQWGRKNGNGYDDNTDASSYSVNTATTPSASSLSSGSEFYIWWTNLYENFKYAWSTNTSYNPDGFKYIPCPEGWELPSEEEMKALYNGNKSGFTVKNNQNGYWFSGDKAFDSENLGSSVFFPAAGQIYNNRTNYEAKYRGSNGYYWTSSVSQTKCFLSFTETQVKTDYVFPYDAYSVRCVKSKKLTSNL